MAVHLNPSLTHRHYPWTGWKAALAIKSGVHQFEEQENGSILVWFYDGPEIHICTLWTGEVPLSESQEQNDAALADFTTNYAPLSNMPVEPKARDGRPAIRVSTANRATNFKLRALTFTTACFASGMHNVNPLTDADYGDMTVKIYDADGALITSEGDEHLAVKTVIDWEPTYNYEIIGGLLDMPTDLKNGTTNEWFISAIGVPDYPPEYYGSIDFISEVNLEAVTVGRVISDGRAISFLPYNYGGMPHTNKLRFIVKHPVGVKKRFQLFLEHFT